MGSLMTSSDDLHYIIIILLHYSPCCIPWGNMPNGGIWFCGLRCIDGKLRIQPHLPAEWHHLHYTHFLKGGNARVNVCNPSPLVTNHSKLKSVNLPSYS